MIVILYEESVTVNIKFRRLWQEKLLTNENVVSSVEDDCKLLGLSEDVKGWSGHRNYVWDRKQ